MLVELLMSEKMVPEGAEDMPAVRASACIPHPLTPPPPQVLPILSRLLGPLPHPSATYKSDYASHALLTLPSCFQPKPPHPSSTPSKSLPSSGDVACPLGKQLRGMFGTRVQSILCARQFAKKTAGKKRVV